MEAHDRDEMIGRIYRQQADFRKAVSFIDAELSEAAAAFKKVATQIECLISHQPSDVGSALSRINADRIIKIIGERERLQRRLADTREQLKRLGARPSSPTD